MCESELSMSNLCCRDKNPRIGDIFVTKGPFLKLYTSYIREFENMTTGLDDARRKYPEFDKVCSDFEVWLLQMINEFCYHFSICKNTVPTKRSYHFRNLKDVPVWRSNITC